MVTGMPKIVVVSGWDFVDTWKAFDGMYYPHLAYEWSTDITNAMQLQNMKLQKRLNGLGQREEKRITDSIFFIVF